jgi:hypothetical protein
LLEIRFEHIDNVQNQVAERFMESWSRFQWVWNLRLELGHQLEPEPMRTTEFAPAAPETSQEAAGYGPSTAALPWKAGRFSGGDFLLAPDGTLRCPAGQSLRPTERRREADGSLRVLYAARISQCRSCQVREQCQWHGKDTKKPRRVSLLLHPLMVAPAPLLWRDWSRRTHRRACMQLLRSQRVDVQVEPASQTSTVCTPPILSRAKRAHTRLSWEERLARNASGLTADLLRITLFGMPEAFATSLGLPTA